MFQIKYNIIYVLVKIIFYKVNGSTFSFKVIINTVFKVFINVNKENEQNEMDCSLVKGQSLLNF